MEEKFLLIADGVCGKCDYMSMVALCEERIYDGGAESSYRVHCNHCGAQVDFTDYYARVTELTIVMYLDKVIPGIRDCTAWYFNKEYVLQRIEMCKRVIEEFYPEFQEYVHTPQCNAYILMFASKALFNLLHLLDEYNRGIFGCCKS